MYVHEKGLLLLQGCACMCECVNKVYALCQMYKAYAHGDCCEAMHACVGVCVWACTRRMVTVIAARRCMHMWEFLCFCMQQAYGHNDCCEAMNVCAYLCVPMKEAYARGDCCKAMHVCMCMSA
jgi:hypothetical protein